MFQRGLVDDCSDDVLRMTRHVVESFGPRPPGSQGERQAQHYLRDQLEPAGDVPVLMEPFPVAPQAFMAVPLLIGVLLAAAIVSWWVSPWLALAVSTAAVAILFVELGLYRQLIDPLFPKRTSHNVLAVRRPSGEVRRRLVLNAHPDAAYEWRWLVHLPRRFRLVVLYAFGSLGVVFCLDAAAVVLELGGSDGERLRVPLGLVQLALLPAALIGATFTSFRRVSPGANDNLSGAMIVAALARRLHEAGIRTENTELGFLITGSEEAGLRGAKAFVLEHADDWRDVPTAVVTLDTIRDLEHLHVYSRDRNGTVRHDPRVCRLLHEAGQRCGVELGYASVYLGSTDATAFTVAGIPAAALCAMDPRPADYYHNRRDRPESMNRACVAKALEILLEAIDEYDRRGLPAAG
jgi:hypothetical protein